MVDVGIVFQKMLMLLVMMSIGFLAGKTRVMSVESNHMLSLLINKITMPCLVVYSSVCNAHSMSNRELLILLGIYFVSFVLMIVVARLFRLLVSPERGHAGIYELLLNKYDLKAEECLFFDDRADNVEGARNLGIQAVQVTSREMLNETLDQMIAE